MVYMPKDLTVQQEIIRMNYNDLYTGHFGVTRIIVLIHQKYFWLELNKDIREYIKNYNIC